MTPHELAFGFTRNFPVAATVSYTHLDVYKRQAILSAADVFVLATSNEGWANVFLEAMACGLPVVTTDVGGNQEVVCDDSLGKIVPFGDTAALAMASMESFQHSCDATHIRNYAEKNSWDGRVFRLCGHFLRITQGPKGQHE